MTDEEKVIVTKSKLDALATSISTKSGESLPMTIAQMKSAVDGISIGADTISLLKEQIYNSYPNVEAEEGPIVSLTDGADGIPVKSLAVDIEPVQEGSGDPSPDNVRPITGWTGAKVWDDPAYGGTIKWNQLLSQDQAVAAYNKFGLTFAMISGKMGFKVTGTFSFESGDRNAYIYRLNNPIAIIKDHVYCIAYDSKYATVYCYGAQFSGNWTGYAPHGGSIIKATNSANLNLSLNFGPNISNGTVFNEEILINLFDLTEMFGEEKADEIFALDMQSPRGQGVTWFKALLPNDYYEQDNSYTETCVSAVNGNPYRHVDITFPAEAGTVYGGSLDVTNGVLTVDKAMLALNTANMDNSNDYPGWRTSGIHALIGEGVNGSVYGAFTNISPASAHGGSGGIGANTRGNNDLLILLKAFFGKTQDDWQALAIDVQIVVPLATPITYQLTPTEVKTLLGSNNIWADTGDVKEMAYRADTKMYIDGVYGDILADYADALVALG